MRAFDDVVRNEALLTEKIQCSALSVLEEALAIRRLVEFGVGRRRMPTPCRLRPETRVQGKRLSLWEMWDLPMFEIKDASGS